jgi:hypothetical protein
MYECTILTAAEGKRLTKRYTDPAKKPDDYDAGYLFQADPIVCVSFSVLITALETLGPDQCLIRGGVKAEALDDVLAGLEVRRLAYDDEDGPAAFEAGPRNWIVLDVDTSTTPFDVDDPDASVDAWHDTLPSEIRGAQSAFFLSANAHRSPHVRGKLLVPLDAPLSNADAEAWAAAHGFDGSVCRTVQPNYFAAPIFDGCADPLEGFRGAFTFPGAPATLGPIPAKAPSKGTTALAKREAMPTQGEPLSARALAVAGVISDRWLGGNRVEGNAWLHLAGWCLGKGWSKGELAALLAHLDVDEPDARKVAEHRHILGNARALEGPGGSRAWLADDFAAVDKIVGHDATMSAWADRRADRFKSPLEAHAAPEEIEPALDDLPLDVDKQGRPLGTHVNAARVLEHVFDSRVYFDEHSGRVLCADISPDLGWFPDGQWTDVHTTAFVILCNQMRFQVGMQTAFEAVTHHARINGRNLLADAVQSMALAWDGVPRVDQAMARYWGAVDDDASRAVSRVFLLSLAARALDPGCKVDTCPVMRGTTGIRKSMSFEVLVGAAWFSDSPLQIGSLDGMQVLRGKWLWELAENASAATKDRNTVKAFLSSRADTYRASYGRFTETVPRQTCFVITTNDEEVLSDPTGARRFLPIVAGVLDVEGIRTDREQLIGEAAARVLGGEQWWPTAAEDDALALARENATELGVRHDPWEEPIQAWLERRRMPETGGLLFSPEALAAFEACPPLGDPTPFVLTELVDEASGAVPMPVERFGKAQQMRIAHVLRTLGLTRLRAWGGRKSARGYVWCVLSGNT